MTECRTYTLTHNYNLASHCVVGLCVHSEAEKTSYTIIGGTKTPFGIITLNDYTPINIILQSHKYVR